MNSKKKNPVILEESGILKCVLCDFYSPSFPDLSKHLESIHSFDKETINFLDHEIESKRKKMAAKTKNQSNFECKHCNKLFESYKGMKQHIGKIHSNTHKNKKCQQCGGKFRDKYALRYHFRQVHTTITRVQCSSCSKILYNKYHLERHKQCCPMD